jgi:hypothetical protein
LGLTETLTRRRACNFDSECGQDSKLGLQHEQTFDSIADMSTVLGRVKAIRGHLDRYEATVTSRLQRLHAAGQLQLIA